VSQTHDTHRPSGFHPVSVGHLTTGVAVLGLVGAWALWQFGPAGNDDVRWLLAAPWVLAGVVGLVASAVTGGRRHRTHGPVEPGWVGVSDDRAYDPPTAPQPYPQSRPQTDEEQP
jgi:hypothetical protein